MYFVSETAEAQKKKKKSSTNGAKTIDARSRRSEECNTSGNRDNIHEDPYHFEIFKLNRFSDRFQQKRTFRALNGILRKECRLRESLLRAANQ